MRRKTFDVLFENKTGMASLIEERSLWRSLWYFTLSVGLFSGVVTNQLFSEMDLGVRFALIATVVVITGVILCLYGFLLHGILETVGATSGDAISLICLLGYTTLPFLMFTPIALVSTKVGLTGVFIFTIGFLLACLWMLYLLMRALQVVYIIDSKRAISIVLFSLLLLYIAIIFPIQVLFKLTVLKFS